MLQTAFLQDQFVVVEASAYGCLDLASGTPSTTAEVRVRVCGVASPRLPPSPAGTTHIHPYILVRV
jgi:hypothetical protein